VSKRPYVVPPGIATGSPITRALVVRLWLGVVTGSLRVEGPYLSNLLEGLDPEEGHIDTLGGRGHLDSHLGHHTYTTASQL
jgi:hypothetical protein